MKLAKPHLDIGLFTNDLDAQRAFWGSHCGLDLDHELELEPGWIQHRFATHGSVIKVNHLVKALPERPPSGYARLTIATPAQTGTWSGTHPGGQKVDLVGPDSADVVGLKITVSSADPARLLDFYLQAMEFEPVIDGVVRCGDTLVEVIDGLGGSDVDGVVGPGFRYITMQVFDADQACAEIVGRGGRVVQEPVSFAGVARYGFVADPDGNWIEISARTSLTGVAVTE